MIETEQTITIHVPIDGVWSFARDIRRWASLMPGMQTCDIIDDDHSRWTLKVGVGGLVRTVKVGVQVDQWDGPERVFFTYKLEGDPVSGGGSYTATPKGAQETEVALSVRVEGSGPMAPMWEAMGRPLLPQLAKGFAEQFRNELESTFGTAQPTAVQVAGRSPFASLQYLLRTLWTRLLGRKGRIPSPTE